MQCLAELANKNAVGFKNWFDDANANQEPFNKRKKDRNTIDEVLKIIVVQMIRNSFAYLSMFPAMIVFATRKVTGFITILTMQIQIS